MREYINNPNAVAGLSRRTMLMAATSCAAALFAPRFVHAAESGHLTMMMPNILSPAFADVLVAQSNGHFKKQGLDVELLGVRSGVLPLQNVITGKTQLARTGTIVMVKAVEKGAKCKSIASIAQGSSFFLVSLESDPIRTPKDAVGESIGVVSLRGPMDLVADAMLAAEDVALDSVKRQIVSDNPGSVALMEAKRVKGFFANAETIARIRTEGTKIHILDPQQYMPLPSQVYIAANDEIDKNGDTFVAFIKAVAAAIHDIVADKSLDATIAGLKRINVGGMENEDAAKAAIRGVQRSWFAAGEDNLLRNVPQNWTKGMAVAVKSGMTAPIPMSSLYTNALVDKALGQKS